MVQVDVFWGYGFGASLALASGNQLAKTAEPFYTKYFVKTVLFLSLFWAPTGMLLLLKHPSWETMQVTDNFLSMSPWLVLSFGITNVTQGVLGFWIGQKLMAKGNYLYANLNWIFGYFGMFLFCFTDGMGWVMIDFFMTEICFPVRLHGMPVPQVHRFMHLKVFGNTCKAVLLLPCI